MLLALLAPPSSRAQASSPEWLYGLTADDRVVTVRSDAPGTVLAELTLAPAPGTALPDLLAIDHLPFTGELLGLGSDGRVHVVDEGTGQVRLRSTASAGDLTGRAVGFDLLAPDRAVVVVDDGRVVTLELDSGRATTEVPRYAADDAGAGAVPRLVAVTETEKELRAVDASRDVLVVRP